MHSNKNTSPKMSEEFDNNQCLLYFQEALSLLEEYQWVFNFPVTHLLALNVLNEVPSKWKNVLSCMSTEDLNTLPLGVIKVHNMHNTVLCNMYMYSIIHILLLSIL
jgi:hypothetical protein